MTAWDFKADDKGMTYPEPMDAIPAEFEDIAAEKREELLDAAANYDDELMELILEDEEIPVEKLKAAIRAGVLSNELNPCPRGLRLQEQGRAGAARRRRRLPAEPARRSPGGGHQPQTGEADSRKASDTEPFSALAFKIATRPLRR